MKITRKKLEALVREEVGRFQRAIIAESDANSDFFKMHNMTRKLWRVMDILRIMVERRDETGPITNEDAWQLLREAENIVREIVRSAEELEYKYDAGKAGLTYHENPPTAGMWEGKVDEMSKNADIVRGLVKAGAERGNVADLGTYVQYRADRTTLEVYPEANQWYVIWQGWDQGHGTLDSPDALVKAMEVVQQTEAALDQRS